MAVLGSLLNVVCAYDPIGYGVPCVSWRTRAHALWCPRCARTPDGRRLRVLGAVRSTIAVRVRYNYLMFADPKEALAEVAAQVRWSFGARAARTPRRPFACA